ncbi:MAG: glycosyltransferase family 1 protein [Bryobacteraceae bacterium]
MIVAIDATPLTTPTGGVSRYTAELSRALAEEFPDDEFRLVSDQRFAVPEGAAPNLRAGGGPRSAVERKWWLWGLAQELSRIRADVFHGTDFAVPYLPLRPSVMTLHDLSPWRDPRWHANADRIRRRTPLLLRAGLATMVITPSEAVRQEAIAHFRLAPERVRAIPLAAATHFRPIAKAVDTPYFLYVGTLEPRKNLEMLIDAWSGVRRTNRVDLVLAGRHREDFKEPAKADGLRLTGAVSEAELPELYSNAAAVLYPSFYEGFGLPVLEAMQCGALVITSRDPALIELSADGAVHVDAADRSGWAEAMRSALAGSEGEGMRECALLRSAAYSWKATAAATRDVYEEARRRHRRER